MNKSKNKKALGWWQNLNAGDPEKNMEIFNKNMTYNTSGESSEAAMAEAIESIIKNPETNLEALKALNLMDEEFITPEQREKEYKKHVKGKNGDKFAYFKNKNWSEEDYEKAAEEKQETPVDNKNVKGFENQDGSRAKYFPKDKDQSFVFYRQYKNGKKKTISYYSMRGMGEQEYKLRKFHNAFDKDVNPDGPENQRDLEIGENYGK